MTSGKTILDAVTAITEISNDKRLEFEARLHRILIEIIDCLQVKKGSIMLLKNKKTLEVVASTISGIVGTKQNLEVESPSSWVVKNRKPLYVDSASKCDLPIGRFKHYRGDAFFLAPIIAKDQVVGIVSVTEKIGTDTFQQEEREVLLHIMGQIIITLENNRLAESLKKKQKVLQRKNLELKKLEKLRTELFNMLIHDLKAPISDIVANLDLLSYKVEAENMEFVETAQSGCNTLYNMISNLLDISRLEEGKLALIYEEILPEDLVKEALARLLVSVKSKGLKFVEEFAHTGQKTVQGDRSLLIRVLQNLLTNAIQFSPRGETITVGFTPAAPNRIEFFIKDNGPGIPEQSQKIIFDKYSQLNTRPDGRVYTAGLGLAFCKMAVDAHGGRIDIASDGRKGSKFFFVIPHEVKKR